LRRLQHAVLSLVKTETSENVLPLLPSLSNTFSVNCNINIVHTDIIHCCSHNVLTSPQYSTHSQTHRAMLSTVTSPSSQGTYSLLPPRLHPHAYPFAINHNNSVVLHHYSHSSAVATTSHRYSTRSLTHMLPTATSSLVYGTDSLHCRRHNHRYRPHLPPVLNSQT